MPGYYYDGAAWQESTVRARTDAGAWTDEDDLLWAHDGSSFVLIQPDPAAAGDLLPVEDLAVTDVTESAVTVSWTMPTQPFVTPTEVHINIPELSNIWTIFDLPTTGYSHNALDAATPYQILVRLARRVDGIITDQSVVRSVFFETDAEPIGQPAPDPGGTVGDTIIPWTPVGGTPAPAGSPTGCYWDWKLQILNQTTLAWTDTGITGTADGDSAAWSYDLATLDPTRVYRLARREVCNTIAGAWEYGDPFAGLGDWGAECGGITPSASQTFVAATPIWGFPEMCLADGGQRQAIFDAITGIEIEEGANFGAIYRDTEDEWAVSAGLSTGPILAVPFADMATVFVPGADFTVALQIRFPLGYGLSNGRITALLNMGFGNVIQMSETATGWKARISILGDGVAHTLESAEVTLDTEYHSIVLRWDASASKDIWIDGVSSASGLSALEVSSTYTERPSMVAYLRPAMTARKFYGWDRALSDAEIGQFETRPVEYIARDTIQTNSGSSTAVPVPAGAIADDIMVVVFDSAYVTHTPARTGFTAIASLTAGGQGRHFVLAKRLTGAEASAGTLTFTHSGSSLNRRFRCYLFRYACDVADIVVSETVDTAAGSYSSFTPAAVTVAEAGSYVLASLGRDTATSGWTVAGASGWSVITEADSSGGLNQWNHAAWRAANANVTPPSYSGSAQTDYRYSSIVIRPR